MSVHGAGAYDATTSPRAIRRSIPQLMVAFVSGVRYIRSERATFRPTPGVPVPFGCAQPSHGCEGSRLLLAGSRCDTEQPKDCDARLIEAVAPGFLARRETEARRQMDGPRATTQMQLSESTAAADMPTTAAARTEGQMHPPQRALQPSRKSAREKRPSRAVESREWIRTADFAPLQFDWLILQYYKTIPAASYLLDRTT